VCFERTTTSGAETGVFASAPSRQGMITKQSYELGITNAPILPKGKQICQQNGENIRPIVSSSSRKALEMAKLGGRLGAYIRKVRRARGWGQEELARRSGISSPHVSRIETGERDPSFATMIKVAKALGLSLDQIADATTRGDLIPLPSDLQESPSGHAERIAQLEQKVALLLEIVSDQVARGTLRLDGALLKRLK